MNAFRGRHCGAEVLLRAVRWSCRDAVSHRDLEQMPVERASGVGNGALTEA